jgi:hypothetical protein
MKTRLFAFLFAVLLGLSASGEALATTYIYTGNPTTGPIYPNTGDYVTASIDLMR